MRIVLKEEATRKTVARDITSIGFTLQYEQQQDKEKRIPYEVVYIQQNLDTSIHYVEDFVYGENYLLLQGANTAQLAEKIQQLLPVYNRKELLEMADKTAAAPEYLKAMTNLIVGAPAEYDREFFIRMEKALQHPASDFRYSLIERMGYLNWMDVANLLGNIAIRDDSEDVRTAAKSLSDYMISEFLERSRLGGTPWLDSGEIRLLVKNLGENQMDLIIFELTNNGFILYAVVEKDEVSQIPAEAIFTTPDRNVFIHYIENRAYNVNYVLVRGSAAVETAKKVRDVLAIYSDMDVLAAASTAKMGEQMIAAMTCLTAGAPAEYDEAFFRIIKKALGSKDAAIRRTIVERLDFMNWPELYPVLQQMNATDADETVRMAAKKLLEQYE